MVSLLKPLYLALQDCKKDGYVCYGGRGANSKIATRIEEPEIYWKRIKEMEIGLWIIPPLWFLLYFIKVKPKIEKDDNSEKKQQKNSDDLSFSRCPTCGKQRKNIKFGKYKCDSCGQKFAIDNHGIHIIPK